MAVVIIAVAVANSVQSKGKAAAVIVAIANTTIESKGKAVAIAAATAVAIANTIIESKSIAGVDATAISTTNPTTIDGKIPKNRGRSAREIGRSSGEFRGELKVCEFVVVINVGRSLRRRTVVDGVGVRFSS